MNLAAPVPRPRRLVRLWWLVRDGLPADTRYRRYAIIGGASLGAIWLVTLLYLLLAPVSFASRVTFILPGSGSGGSLNLDQIGQASATTASPFSSSSLSPTENYKRLLMSDIVRDAAGVLAGAPEGSFPEPTVKLVDQTNLIEVAIKGRTPRDARARAEALRRAFLERLDALRRDEAARREAADRSHIDALQDKVRAAQRRLLAFQGATGLVSLDQFNARVAALDTLHDRAGIARTQLRMEAASSARLAASLHISIADARRAMLLRADPIFQSLLARYASATTAGTEKAATLGPRHAEMEEIDAGNNALRTALVARGRSLSGLSPATLLAFADLAVTEGRARMLETMVTGNAQAEGQRAAVAEIQDQIARQSAKSGQLVQQAATLTDLVRDLRVAEAVFSTALARLDTNKSDSFASYPLVQTLEAPALPHARASPSLPLALAGAIGATLLTLLGLGLSWLRQPIIHKLLPNA